MASRRQPPGFTLIELMIVIVVVGILALLAIPRFTGVTLQARQAEAAPVLKQLCQLAESDRERTGGAWPAGNPTAWVVPNAKYFTFSHAGGVATATAVAGGVATTTLNCTTGVMDPP
jgi:type IV pilus assembly protein PilE